MRACRRVCTRLVSWVHVCILIAQEVGVGAWVRECVVCGGGRGLCRGCMGVGVGAWLCGVWVWVSGCCIVIFHIDILTYLHS